MRTISNSTVRAAFSAALPATRIRLAQFAALVAIASTFCGFAPAQVPEESAIIGTFSGPNSKGTSGLFLIPLAGGAMTPVTGLPAALQQTGGVPQQGVRSVGHRADGMIVVGTVAAATGPTQGDIELYLLYLNGSAVDPARTRKILLGTTDDVGGAFVEPLPDGRVLVAASNRNGAALPTGPMANNLFAIVDVSKPTPAFTLLPNPPGTGSGGEGGFAVDPTGKYLFYALTTGFGSPSVVASLYRWDLVTNKACVIASWPGQLAFGLTCDDDGTVYVSANNGTTLSHYTHTVSPNGCNPAATTAMQSSLSLPVQNIAQDRASGRFVMATGFVPGFPNNFLNSVWLIHPATGVAALIAAPTPGGWGVMGGVAVNNAIESYGTPTNGLNRYWFQNFPNPSGLPTVGNQAFSLTSRSAPGTSTLSVFALSTGRGSTQLLGAQILVDLNNSFLVTLSGATSTTIPLPIPNDPSLIGSVFMAQTAHFEGGPFVLKASRGLTLTIR